MALYTVTGGAGFIGSHLVDRLLSCGHRVRVLDDLSTGKLDNLDQRCEFIRGDVADPTLAAAALAGVAGCFHLAAIASVQRANEEWLAAHRANQTGTVAVLDAARAGRTPVVYASSAAVYGDIGAGIAHEDSLPAPLTAYGADKLGSELHARVAYLVHGVPTLGMRFFNVYGPRQDPFSPYSGVISIFSERVARGLTLTVNGAGDQVRDFIHVRDVVEHLVAGMDQLASAKGAGVVNVCTGIGTTVLELARIIGTIEERSPTLCYGPPRPGDIRNSVGDPSLATSMLGVAAGMDLRQGLAGMRGVRGQEPLRAQGRIPLRTEMRGRTVA